MTREDNKSSSAGSAPMTRRGPDGRPYVSAETEQRAADAQKASSDRTQPVSIPVNGPPD